MTKRPGREIQAFVFSVEPARSGGSDSVGGAEVITGEGVDAPEVLTASTSAFELASLPDSVLLMAASWKPI